MFHTLIKPGCWQFSQESKSQVARDQTVRSQVNIWNLESKIQLKIIRRQNSLFFFGVKKNQFPLVGTKTTNEKAGKLRNGGRKGGKEVRREDWMEWKKGGKKKRERSREGRETSYGKKIREREREREMGVQVWKNEGEQRREYEERRRE